MSEIKKSRICEGGFIWPGYKVLQQLVNRRHWTSRWYRLRVIFGICQERRKK